MNKYIALLRGINVGGNNKVEMPKLKKSFESLGYEGVSTYINTGNVIFETNIKDTEQTTTEIEKILEKDFGFKIRVVVRSSKNIKELCKKIPTEYSNNTEQKTDVLFLRNTHDNKKSIDLIKINKDVDTLKYIPGAIVWNIQKSDYAKSGMHKFIGTEIYKHMTARNINTVRKILELMK